MTRGWRARARRATRTRLGRAAIALGLAILCLFDADVSAFASGYAIGPTRGVDFVAPIPDLYQHYETNGPVTWHYNLSGKMQVIARICNTTNTWAGAVVSGEGDSHYGASGSGNGNPSSISCPSQSNYLLGAVLMESPTTAQSTPLTQLGCISAQPNGMTGCAYTTVRSASVILTEWDWTDQSTTSSGGSTPCSVQAAASLTLNPADNTVDLLSVRITLAAGQAVPPAGWRIDSPAADVSGDTITFVPARKVGYMGQGAAVSGPIGVYFKTFTLNLATNAPTQITASDGSTIQEISVAALSSRSPDTAMCFAIVQVSAQAVTSTGGGGGSTWGQQGGGGSGSTDTSCSFSWNVLHDVECALAWAFVPDSNAIKTQWQSTVATVEGTAVGQVVVAGAGYINSYLQQTQAGGGCGSQGVICGGTTATTYDHQTVDVFAAASGLGSGSLQDLMAVSIWLTAFFAVWRVFRSAFGSHA